MNKNKIFSVILILLVLAALTLSACSGPINEKSKADASEKLDAIAQEVFAYEAGSDTLSLQYMLIDPEKYGVSAPDKPTFGDFTEEAFIESIDFYTEEYKKLKKVNRKALDSERQYTYDLLSDYLEPEKDDKASIHFIEALSPTLGQQSNMPVTLAEYRLDTKEDVETYITLLSDLPRYFAQIADFEEKKLEWKTFMPLSTANEVIAQIADFIVEPENNFLITGFKDRLAEVDGLSSAEVDEYVAQNKAAVLESIIPAYETLLDSFKSLNEGNTRTGGLYELEGGAEYYQEYVQDSTGTKYTMKELDALLEARYQKIMEVFLKAQLSSTNIIEEATNPKWPTDEPAEILDLLKVAIDADFVPIKNDTYKIEYVDKSLEDYLSPAFFFTPPVDGDGANPIYINSGQLSSADVGNELFPTLAHEGFPGHLYQFAFYNEQKPAPIRRIIEPGGYIEGWATYVEHISPKYAGLSEEVAELYSEDAMWGLVVQSKVDLGVNYYGWGVDEISEYLSGIGITDESVAKNILESVIADPGNVMKYTLGCMEFEQLRDKAKEAQGENFNLKDFHSFVLEVGPSPFYMLDARMDVWLEK